MRERAAVLEALELHLGVIGAGRVDHQRAEPVAALDRPLRDVDVLDARSRHVDHHAPVDALADLDALVVHPVERVLIRARGPAIRLPRQKQHHRQPRGRQQHPPHGRRSVRAEQVDAHAHKRADGDNRRENAAGDALKGNHPRIQAVPRRSTGSRGSKGVGSNGSRGSKGWVRRIP